jgi:protease I
MPGELTGRRVAVLVDNDYQELEVWYPLLRMREAGAEVFTIGPEADTTYKSKIGYPVEANRAIGDVDVGDFDALIIPGGWAPDYMRRNPQFVDLVADSDRAGKVIGAICHGPWILCSAGVLKGRQATAFYSIKDDLVNAGANYVDDEVVVDQNLITSRVPGDLPAFCQAIISAVGSSDGDFANT